VPNDPVAEARATWPGVALSDEDFVAHLATKVAPAEALQGAMHRLHLPELFLACACARRDPAAIAHFERACFEEVDAAYRRFDALPLTLDDVRQRVRAMLFLADPPAVAGYSGAGALRGWLRAAVLHLLINVQTREARERPTEGAFFEAVVDASPNAEAAYLKEACRAEFEQAFLSAMASMEPRDRALLRYAFADGLNVDQIGTVYRVHRATAARWVAAARDALVERTRGELMVRLRVSETDALSIVRVALSRMGTSLLRRLGEGT
jgi:RNA polymerase sigma-70 factor (ECF subfamily)